jgi:hypothetical protein
MNFATHDPLNPKGTFNHSNTLIGTSRTGTALKFMPPGHFCPDVCGIEDFGDADTWRGRTVRGFFRLMRHWPKPRPKH